MEGKFLDPDLLDSTCISTIKAKKFSFTEEKISNESNLILVDPFVPSRLQASPKKAGLVEDTV